MRDRILECDVDIVEREPRLHPKRHAQAGVITQRIKVVGVLVTAADGRDASLQDVIELVGHPRGITPI